MVSKEERNISLVTLDKIILGLEITPSFLFQFQSVDMEREKNKKDILSELQYNLQSMNTEELVLIKGVLKNIIEYTKSLESK